MDEGALLFSMIIYLFFFFLYVEAQQSPEQAQQNPEAQTPDATATLGPVNSFRPSVAVVIGVLSIMFSLTLLLLIYAKFCHTSNSDLLPSQNRGQIINGSLGAQIRTSSRFSGIDKKVIESLPFFRFSSLKGSRDGLECAVCLSKFEDAEVLRLLPKCKHAFHLTCVDQWLESHSSCPLCRHKIDPEDLDIFTYSSRLAFARNQSDLSEDPNVELFVRRELDNRGSSRFSVGSSFRMMNDKEGAKTLPFEEIDGYKHKDGLKQESSITSDVVFMNRWSDVSSSDLISLNLDMFDVANEVSTMRIKEEMEKGKSSKLSEVGRSHHGSFHGLEQTITLPSTSDSGVNNNYSRYLVPSAGKRSMSDITKLSRFGGRNRSVKESSSDGRNERMRRLWFPIARRTVEWIAGRERRLSKQTPYTRQNSMVYYRS